MHKPKIKIVIVPPDKNPFVRTIKNTPETMEKLVGGEMETFLIGIADGMAGVTGVCNKNGLIENLPSNRYVPEARKIIRGTFFIVGENPNDGSFKDITFKQCEAVLKQFENQNHTYNVIGMK